MQKWRARGNDHAIEVLLQNVVADQMLTRIGAHEGVNLGYCNAWNQSRRLGHALYINDIGDVPAATADVYADPRLVVVLVRFPFGLLIACLMELLQRSALTRRDGGSFLVDVLAGLHCRCAGSAIVSTMSFGPAAVPATRFPAR